MNQMTPMRKLIIPKHIDEFMKRMEEAYQNYISSQTSASVQAVLMYYLKKLKVLHSSLKNGEHPILNYNQGEADKHKIELMKMVTSYLAPLPCPAIKRVCNKIVVERGLRYRLKNMRHNPKTQEEATALIEFIDNAYNSAWGNDDEFFPNKTFRIIDSKQQWEDILKTDGIELLTSDKNVRPTFTTIQVAMLLKEEEDIYAERGLYEDFTACVERHFPSPGNAIKMFAWWHGIAPTATFFVWLGNK